MFGSNKKSCRDGGDHCFERFLIRITPPTPELITSMGDSIDDDYVSIDDLLDSLSAKEWVVICTCCGKKAE